MSRVTLKSKTEHAIAVGIDPTFQMWFIQVFDLLENQKEDEGEKLLVDLDTSNRWKVVEVIDEYADLEDEFTAKVREQVMLDLDPGLLIGQPVRMVPLDITKMNFGEIK